MPGGWEYLRRWIFIARFSRLRQRSRGRKQGRILTTGNGEAVLNRMLGYRQSLVVNDFFVNDT